MKEEFEGDDIVQQIFLASRSFKLKEWEECAYLRAGEI